jgi:hypothetical protein
MSDMTIFEAKGAINAELFESLKDVNDNLLSGASLGGGKSRRISISGGKFREFVGGEQIAVSKQDYMNVVIVNAAAISRTYYASEYNPEKIEPPYCWSADTTTPSKEVPEEQRQSARCMDCPQNVKGSGQGQTRACRFAQRLAVVLEDDLDNVYQLQLPATSIFGDIKNGNMPMQAYAKHLANHKAPAIAIVTKMYFDENSPTPKLFFKPVRALEEEEVQKVLALKEHPDTIRAITLTVSQTDGVQKSGVQTLFMDKKEDAKVEVKAVEAKAETEEVSEPKKVVKKSTPPPSEESVGLNDIVAEWDDD